MPHEILVEYTRGDRSESQHHGAYCVVEGGAVVRSKGDIEVPVFYRSACKPLQTIAVVESGAADRFGFTAEELALVVGSHDGSRRHAENAASMLRKAGASPDLLRCGGHVPLSREVYEQYVREGKFWARLEDNCSGKHAGMIAASCAYGEDPARYAEGDARVQRENLENVALFTGVPAERIARGVDGCAAPNFAVPVRAMALAMARFTSPEGLPDAKAAIARRITASVLANPDMIAGPKRFDTRLIRAAKGALLSKEGAEGVQVVGLLGRDTGIAVKIADGGKRAAEAVIATLLVELGAVPADEIGYEERFRSVRNREGSLVGEARVLL